MFLGPPIFFIDTDDEDECEIVGLVDPVPKVDATVPERVARVGKREKDPGTDALYSCRKDPRVRDWVPLGESSWAPLKDLSAEAQRAVDMELANHIGDDPAYVFGGVQVCDAILFLLSSFYVQFSFAFSLLPIS